MTSDRKRKKDARAYKASHDSTYGDALRAVAISPGRGRRRRRATKALRVPASTLVEALARFLDRRPPATPDVVNLVEETLTKLEEVPSRRRPLQDDLTHALTTADDKAVEIPEVIPSLRGAARFLKSLLAEVDNTELIAVATDLGVSERTVNYAAFLIHNEQRRSTTVDTGTERDSFLSVDSPEAEAEESERDARRDAQKRAQTDTVARLRNHNEGAWEPIDRDTLRLAIALDLAEMGDAFLTVSESPEPPPTLTWRPLAGGCTRADMLIPKTTMPLSAVAEPNLRHASEPGSTPEFYRPDRRRATFAYTCYVGVFTAEVNEFDSFGREFDQYDIDSAYASAAAAQFACAHMVGRIASNAYSARSYPDGRVLIPRQAGQPDDETTLVFDLSIALHYSRHDITRVDKLWVSSPHVSEDDVLSVTALALDSHSFACPRPSDAANSVTVEQETFQDYLATQGVRMTNSALTYLAGTADAGAGGQSLSDRHTAGMNAVLTTRGLRAVVSELQPQYPALEEWILATNNLQEVTDVITDISRLTALLVGFDEEASRADG
ncbi:hypothetical protein HZU40_00705 (plasmid) [Mycolicibacterium fluoranthenivorans]|uniref:Uncharacterized protein n=1 Tax=Mycolicibacterium fluoranthenivorans TaxID=258505 RepID=A0A7G8P6P3_9MYCO|nr:hypothetical protein [Mycolicibacterium fluoranthenivorans]QNJ90009.1 hypothetical protein HZU40_00705 [Mycolicibacterium fluoranthenivorans]